MQYKCFFLVVIVLFINACSVKKTNSVQLNLRPVVIKKNKPTVENITPNKEIDVLHINLFVSFNWNKHECYGEEELLITPYYYSLDSLRFDAKNLKIRSLQLLNMSKSKIPCSYFSKEDELIVVPNEKLNKGDSLLLSLNFTASPDERLLGGSQAIKGDKGLYFINTDRKEPFKPTQLWTQGETEANSNWFVCIDKPHEKSTFDLHIKVDDSLQVLSNGNLVSIKKESQSNIFHWNVSKPMSAYLVMMAIGKFEKTNEYWKDKEVSYYLEEKYHPFAKNIFKHTPEMIDFFSNKLGVAYPWEKYSQVVVHDFVSGAMENTSATLHGSFVQKNDRELLDDVNDGIIAHELFHQWFGDLVTCESWSQLTLNEGFATFGEQLWWEHKYSKEEVLEKIHSSMQSYLRYSKRFNHPLIYFQYKDKEDMFDPISYQKGARVLNLLRNELGENAFFDGLKYYLEQHAFQSVQIDDFRRSMEKVSGKDLRTFFTQWYLTNGHPILKMEKEKNDQNWIVRLTQDQEGPLFDFPFTINTVSNGRTASTTIRCKNKVTEFKFPLESPFYLYPDPEKIFIGEIIYEQNLEELKLSYPFAKNYIEKRNILDKIADVEKTLDIDEQFILSVLKDNNPSISTYGMIKANWDDEKLLLKAKNTLLQIAQTATNTEQKALAINRLGTKEDNLLIDQFESWSQQPSYAVASAGLKGLYRINKDIGLRQAHKLEQDAASDLQLVIGSIYAAHGSEKELTFFTEQIPRQFNGQRAQLISFYGELATRIKDAAFWDYVKKYAQSDEKAQIRLAGIMALHSYVKKNKTEQLELDLKEIIAKEKDELVIKQLKINKIIPDDKNVE